MGMLLLLGTIGALFYFFFFTSSSFYSTSRGTTFIHPSDTSLYTFQDRNVTTTQTAVAYWIRYMLGTGGGPDCEDNYGITFLTRWQSAGTDYCLPKDQKPISSMSSDEIKAEIMQQIKLRESGDGDVRGEEEEEEERDGFGGSSSFGEAHIRCYKMMPSHQTPEPMNVCLMKNVVLDTTKIRISSTADNNDFYERDKTIFFNGGALRGDCNQVVPDTAWNSNNFPKTTGNWLVRSWQNGATDNPQLCNGKNTINRYMYFVSRYDTTNLFHAMEDFIHAFMAYSVLNIPLGHVQVVIADGLVVGPYLDVWQQLYSRRFPVLQMKEMLTTGPKYQCYKNMMVNVFAAISPLCKQIGMENPCFNSTLVKAFREFFISGYNVKYLPISERKLRNEKMRIVVIQRKDYNSDQHVGSRRITRKLRNHDEVVRALKSKFSQHEVLSVDFAELDFLSQVKLIRTTDVLIGAHGAGLAHLLLLPKTSAVIELWIDDRYGNWHYVNMAKFLELKHILYRSSNPTAVDTLLHHTEEALKSVQQKLTNDQGDKW
jgi:hypothetical protein